MAFRVLVIGRIGIRNYPELCQLLDAALAHRIPAVTLLTTGGPGLPALVASYASSRGLQLVPFVLDFAKYPGDALARRNAELVEEADAVVSLLDAGYDADTSEMMARAKRKGVRVIAVCPARAGSGTREYAPAPLHQGRGLPD